MNDELHGGHPFDGDTVGKLDAVLKAVMARYSVPGAVAGAVAGGRSWIKALGKADLAAGTDVSPCAPFRIASITKTFTAVTVLQLVDEGLVDLDTTVSEYLEDLPVETSVTSRQLLNHTSGIYDYGDDVHFQNSVARDPLRRWLPEELVERGFSNRPYFSPGEGYRYSNTNYMILGMVIERITGNSLSREMETRIFEPLGLGSTFLPDGPDIPPGLVHGYWAPEGKRELEDATFFDPSLAWAAGGMVSNLADILIWARSVGCGELLSEDSHRQQLTWVDASAGGVPYAKYGLGVEGKGAFIGHEGHLMGYNTAMYYAPPEDAAIIVLLNRYFGEPSVAGEAFTYIARLVAPDGLPRI